MEKTISWMLVLLVIASCEFQYLLQCLTLKIMTYQLCELQTKHYLYMQVYQNFPRHNLGRPVDFPHQTAKKLDALLGDMFCVSMEIASAFKPRRVPVLTTAKASLASSMDIPLIAFMVHASAPSKIKLK